jgi:hypothetical protein
MIMEKHSLDTLESTTQIAENQMDKQPLDAADTTTTKVDNQTNLWLKRLGVGGFMFFLAKGILWLVLGKAALSALCN